MLKWKYGIHSRRIFSCIANNVTVIFNNFANKVTRWMQCINMSSWFTFAKMRDFDLLKLQSKRARLFAIRERQPRIVCEFLKHFLIYVLCRAQWVVWSFVHIFNDTICIVYQNWINSLFHVFLKLESLLLRTVDASSCSSWFKLMQIDSFAEQNKVS